MSVSGRFNRLPRLVRWGIIGALGAGGLTAANVMIPDEPELVVNTPVVVEGRFEGSTTSIFDLDKKLHWLDVEYCPADAEAMTRGEHVPGSFNPSPSAVAPGCEEWRIGVDRELYDAVATGQIIPLPKQ